MADADKPLEGKRVHKTFLFTDVVSSADIRAACLREFGDIGNKQCDESVLLPHDQILDRLVADFDGEVISTAGDSYFVAFDSAKSAVECAVALQREFIKVKIPLPAAVHGLPPFLQIRIGLHTGGARELLRANKPNYSDHTINIAARIEGLADGEQVLMSQETWNNAGRLRDITKHDWEGCQLKGIDGDWTLVEALWDCRLARPPQTSEFPLRDNLSFYLRQLRAWLSFPDKLSGQDCYIKLYATQLHGSLFKKLLAFKPDDVLSMLKRAKAPVVVVGAPGSGKTKLLHQFALSLIPEEPTNDTRPIPVCVDLKEYLTAERFEDFLGKWLDAVSRDRPFYTLIRGSLERHWKSGDVLWLLDGLDEGPSQEYDRRLHRLQEFVDAYPLNRYVFATRYFDPGILSARPIRLRELEDQQIKEIIDGVFDGSKARF